MKRKLTALVWAGALLALTLMSVPAAGQEKPVIKTGVVENVPAQDVQLRADDEWTPDSAVVYSPGGEKQTKHVYLPGESYGQYIWENEAWKRSDGEPNTGIFSQARYNRERYNKLVAKVQYRTTDGGVEFFVPGVKGSVSYMHSLYSDIDPEYDTNGNLTSLRIVYDTYNWIWYYTVTYNAKNNPVFIEGRHQDNTSFLKAYYEYNDYGYPVLLDSYEWDGEKGTWVSNHKEAVEYDAQGKIRFLEQYWDGEISYRYSYEYYDEDHLSLMSCIGYGDGKNNSWKYEWKYGTDGNPGAYYRYSGSELALEYYAIFYPNTLTPSAVEPVPERVATRVWSSGGPLYIAAASAGRAQIYTVAGQLMATVALAAGETVATPLPPGVYIVAADGRTWKAVIR